MRFIRVVIGLVLVVSVFGNIVMYMKYVGKRPIITINGQGISKRELDNYLEVRSGPQVKAELVEEMLVTQEAEKKGVLPTDKEVEEIFNDRREVDWQFARQLQQAPWAADEAKKKIRLLLAKERLLIKDVALTPEQLQDEYKQRPALYDTPNKARVELAVVTDASKADDIKTLLQKPVNPSVIMGDLKGSVVFLGYENKLTIQQPFGTKQNDVLFKMKPGEVKDLPPGEFAKLGAKRLIVRLVDITPGHKADMNDPKVKDKLTRVVGAQRSQPWQQYLSKLWADAKTNFEDPNDKKIVEAFFFPERTQAAGR